MSSDKKRTIEACLAGLNEEDIKLMIHIIERLSQLRNLPEVVKQDNETIREGLKLFDEELKIFEDQFSEQDFLNLPMDILRKIYQLGVTYYMEYPNDLLVPLEDLMALKELIEWSDS